MYNPKIFFSGDHHYNHINILSYDNEPFDTIEEHNYEIMRRHNQLVKKEDVCYLNGDFYFRGGKEARNTHYQEFLNQMNGRITIVRGNHEKSNKIIDKIQSASMFISGLKIFVVHDPINSKIECDLNIVAHVHTAWLIAELHEKGKTSLLINCGLSQWNYYPVEWRKLYELYHQWKDGKIKAPIFDKEKVKKIREERRKR